MTNIIGISGWSGSGKTRLITNLVKFFKENYNFKICGPFTIDNENITLQEAINLIKEKQKDILKTFNHEKKTYEIRAAQMNMTKHQIITLASIIEGEAIFNSERSKISAVYHNRLSIDMKLQADPTIQYIINEKPRRLFNKDLRIKSPYNTYINKGLPPGPINSPGKESLLAALFPEENDFLYFVARGDGYHTFSTNKKYHDKAKRKFQKIRRQLKREKNKSL